MGARPSQFKKGGGFLNGVDGVITDYEFTTEFPGGDSKPRKKGAGNSDFTPLFAVLNVRVDGADEDVQTTLNAGNADNFDIEDDGKTLVPTTEGFELSANSGWGKLVTSAVQGGFPEDALPEDRINFEAMINHRFRFVQEKNESATKKYGPRKGKNGKTYDRQDLKIESYLGPAGKAATGSKATASKTPAKGAKAKGGDDVADLATTTIQGILADKGDLPKNKVRMAVFAALGTKHPQKDAVIKHIYDNLDGLDGVEYDAEAETLSLAS